MIAPMLVLIAGSVAAADLAGVLVLVYGAPMWVGHVVAIAIGVLNGCLVAAMLRKE